MADMVAGSDYVQQSPGGGYDVVLGAHGGQGGNVQHFANVNDAQNYFNANYGGGGSSAPAPSAPSGGGGGSTNQNIPTIFTQKYGAGAAPEWSLENQAYSKGWGGWASGVSPQAYLTSSGTGAGGAGSGVGQGLTNSLTGALSMTDARRDLLRAAGNNRWNDPTLTADDYSTISQNAQADALRQQVQQQEDQYQQQLAQQAQTAHTEAQAGFAQSLLSGLDRSPWAPGEIPAINAALQALGLPGIASNAALGAQGVLPNGLTPAMWDAMSPVAQQMLLLAWQARGGDPKDFIAGIDAQRPQGHASTGQAVAFAPLAA